MVVRVSSLERSEAADRGARSETYRWFIRGVGFTLGLLVVYVIANAASLATRGLILVFASILLGSALEPIVGALRSRLPVGRGATLLLVYAGFFLVVAGIVFVVLPDAANQATQLSQRLPKLLDDARTWAAGLRPQPLSQALTALIDSIRGTALSQRGPSADFLVQIGLTVADAAVFLGTLLAMVFFWLTEHARLQRYVLAFVPAQRRPGTRDAWNQVETRLGLWVRGQLLLMAAMAIMTAVLYSILGLPAPLLLAVWAGLAEAIPLIGPLLGAVPALLLAATVRPELVVIAAIVYVGLQFVEGNILVPLIMRNTIGISPFLVVVSLTIGAEIGGIAGAFLAVPVTAAIEVILERLQARDVPVPQDPASAATPGSEEAESMEVSLPDSPNGSAADEEDGGAAAT